jgi:hypothetical protein
MVKSDDCGKRIDWLVLVTWMRAADHRSTGFAVWYQIAEGQA